MRIGPQCTFLCWQEATSCLSKSKELMEAVLRDPGLLHLQQEGGAMLARLQCEASRLDSSPDIRYRHPGLSRPHRSLVAPSWELQSGAPAEGRCRAGPLEVQGTCHRLKPHHRSPMWALASPLGFPCFPPSSRRHQKTSLHFCSALWAKPFTETHWARPPKPRSLIPDRSP